MINIGAEIFNEHKGNPKPNKTKKDIIIPVCVAKIFSTCVQLIMSLTSFIDQSTILLMFLLKEIDLFFEEIESP